MVVDCSRCDAQYNNQTVSRCPLCFPRIIIVSKKRQKQRDKRNEKSRALGIRDFIREDTREKKKTNTGYQHKVKTGGKGRE